MKQCLPKHLLFLSLLSVVLSNDFDRPFKVGFSALTINPEIIDTWIDANGDAKYNPDDGDTYQDNNDNCRFDPVWIAGFHQSRPAAGIHDDLWSRAMVIDNGETRITIIGLDAIGFFYEDAIDVRESLPKDLEIDYTVICSSHDHEAPDLLGVWGGSIFKSGVDSKYLNYVKERTVTAITNAVNKMRPASLSFSQDLTGAAHLVQDSRKPIVSDPGVRIIHAIDAETDTTLGTLISWANHAETLWSDNLLISSDFPHYVREGVEKGIRDGDNTIIPGIGGTAVYINGAIGGLMTTRPNFPIPDPLNKTIYSGATYAKTRAQGYQIAKLVLESVRSNENMTINEGKIDLISKTVCLPVDNWKFRLGFFLGVIDRSMTGWMKTVSEVAAFRIGPASFISVPGEIYPEMVNGGIEAPLGQDFELSPQEVPPLRDLMTGKFKFVLGLANDEIGYIIPKSEWDTKHPYLYHDHDSPYGEENSMGPKTATIIYRELVNLLEELNDGNN